MQNFEDNSNSTSKAKGTNAENLKHALDFLKTIITIRCDVFFNRVAQNEYPDPPSLEYFGDNSAYCNFIEKFQPTFDEYIVFLLALAPHVQPGFLDSVIKKGLKNSTDFPEIGGTRDNENRIFLPTGETALFIIAGSNFDMRFEVQKIFSGDHWFAQNNILKLESAKVGEPFYSGRLILNPDHVELFTIGHISSPNFSTTFPAQEISTELEWKDLVLNPEVREQIEEIKNWIKFHPTLLNQWGLKRKIKPGYRALFYGSPGTGKTLTATLLGKYTNRRVFRVDLSTIVSKYIGETEKNLANLFDKAKSRDWILFFDEADALFGKRTSIKDSHDRFANQEVSYLLQKVEEFDGLVILASNFKSNMDEAFLRRFNSIIQFPLPSEEERAELWRNCFPKEVKFKDNIDLPKLLAKFELTGGNIINVVQYACLKSITRGKEKKVQLNDALQGIKKEVEKEGKIFKNLIQEEWITKN